MPFIVLFDNQSCWRIQNLVLFLIVSNFTPSLAATNPEFPFYIKGASNATLITISSRNTISDKHGNEYSLDEIEPYQNLFSQQVFEFPSETKVRNTRTDEIMDIYIYKGRYEDGTTLILSKIHSAVEYMILVPPGGFETIHYVPVEDSSSNATFVAVSDSDYDYELLGQIYGSEETELNQQGLSSPIRAPISGQYGDGAVGQNGLKGGRGKYSTNSNKQGYRFNSRQQGYAYQNGDGTSAECEDFIVIPITIAFDAEFCQLFDGLLDATLSTIQLIFAVASLYYENNLCAILALSLFWDSCNPQDSDFTSMNRDTCNSYLIDFTEYMDRNRTALGIDTLSWVHMFTGVSIVGNLGCASLPGVCGSDFTYGIDYVAFRPPDIRSSGFVLAHELGHNFNAPHDPTSDGSPNYIMEARLNSGEDGFSPESAELIVNSLLDPLNF
jgi:hypothetical protein